MTDTNKILASLKPFIPAIETVNGVPVGLLPEGAMAKPLDLEQYLEKPKRVRQRFNAHDVGAFTAYVKAFATTTAAMFFNFDSGFFKAVLDYHATLEDQPDGQNANNCDHTAVLKLQHSRELEAWKQVMGKPISQDDWSEFLEERDLDFLTPAPAEIVSIVRDFRAKKITTFRKSQIVESGDVVLQYETDTQSSGEIDIPRDIQLMIPLYRGAKPVLVYGRFAYKIREGELFIRISLPRLDDILLQNAETIGAEINAAVPEIPSFAGET